MQIHTNTVLPHNNIDNESFTQQTLHTIRRWAPIQKGMRPDRPTQPETWRSPETLQESKKHKQSVISLQSPTEACCHRRGAHNMFYDFAYAKADQVADLRRELFNESVEIVSGSDSDYMSESD